MAIVKIRHFGHKRRQYDKYQKGMLYECIQNKLNYRTKHFHPVYLKKGHQNKFPQLMRREPKIVWQQPRKDPRRNKNIHLVCLLVAMKYSKTFYKTERLTRIGPLEMFKFYDALKTQHMVLTNPSLQCNPFAFPLAASTSCFQPFYRSTLPICYKLPHTSSPALLF